MSIRALVTTLILGSSAVAVAKPISRDAWEHQRDNRAEQDRQLRERERQTHQRDAYAQGDRMERDRLARERTQRDAYVQRDRFERDRLARERMDRDRLVSRERWDRDRLARERVERERIAERDRISRIERERRYERNRWERDRWEDRARLERERWIREHRTYRPRYSVDPGYYGRTYYRPGWVSLLAPSPIVNGELFVSIAPEMGAVRTIRLDGTGVSYVSQVVVEYDDGTTQVLTVGRYIDPSNPSLELAVPDSGCARRIVVYGQSEYGGQIAVTAAA